MTPEKRLLVEVVAYAPTAFYHCQHCEVAWRSAGVSNNIHAEQVNSSLPPDLAQDYQVISDWIHDQFQLFGDQIILKMIDAASVEGFFKTLRYRLHHYPTIIINGKRKFHSEALQQASAEIQRCL